MECHHFDSPISTLKVDFECCEHCPMDVKKVLQQLKGVKSISIDPNQGNVTVIGNVNPMMLVKLLQNMGKKAQLWSFNKEPMQGKAGSQPKQTFHCCCESDSQDDYDYDSSEDSISWEHPQYKASRGQKSEKKRSWKDWFGFGNKNRVTKAGTNSQGHRQNSSLPQPPIAGYHPHMPWYQPVTYARPSMYARPVPWYGYHGRDQPYLPSYRHFGSRLLSKYNPMIHNTSNADNYRYTV